MTEPGMPFEVRSIKDGEQEEFLEVMCRSFSLDIERARTVFYADPFFDLRHKCALFDGGTRRILSILTLVPGSLRVAGGALISVAGIAGVCTV